MSTAVKGTIPGRALGRIAPKAQWDHGRFRAVQTHRGDVHYYPRMKFHIDLKGATTADTVDWTTNAQFQSQLNQVIGEIYLNDQLGDCVIASREHGEGVAASNAGTAPPIATDSETSSNYTSACGPGDNGCDMSTVNQYRQNTGLMMAGSRRKSLGAAALDNTNQALVQTCIVLGFNINIGMNLPNDWYQSANGSVWDLTTSSIVGGHEVQGSGYSKVVASVQGFTAAGVKILTWAGWRIITWAAFTSTTWIDECYAELTPAVVNAAGTAPNGLNLQTLQADLALVANGQVPPLPGPPSPPTGPVVTGVSPAFGPPGTTVTISGTNFTGATGVKFGALPGQSVSVVSATSITAVAPFGNGTVDVTVGAASGTSPVTPADQFSYGSTPPSPPAPTYPVYSGAAPSYTGNFPGMFGATHTVTMTPSGPITLAATSGRRAGAAGFLQDLMDLMQLINDAKSGNTVAIPDDILKLLTDLGINIPTRQ